MYGLSVVLLLILFVSVALNVSFIRALRGHKGEEK